MNHVPVCAKCQQDMVCAKNGVAVLDVTGDGTDYKITMADKWKCNICGCEVVVGFAQHALVHHYEPRFAAAIEFLSNKGLLVRARAAGPSKLFCADNVEKGA